MKFKLYIDLDRGKYTIWAEGSLLTWPLFKHKDWDTIKEQSRYFIELFGYEEPIELRSQGKQGA